MFTILIYFPYTIASQLERATIMDSTLRQTRVNFCGKCVINHLIAFHLCPAVNSFVFPDVPYFCDPASKCTSTNAATNVNN